MKKRYSFILFSLLIFATACKEELNIEDEYTLEVGHTVTFDHGALGIKLDEVSDLRRPVAQLGGRDGRAMVKFKIIEEVREYPFTLYLPGLSEEDDRGIIRTDEFGNYEIRLLEVNPYPDFLNSSELKEVAFSLIKR